MYVLDMTEKETIGDRIRFARTDLMLQRQRRKLSQRAIAKHFDISAASVAEWELGSTRPSREKMPALAALLGVSILWLEFGIGLPDQNTNVNVDLNPSSVRGRQVPIVDVASIASALSGASTKTASISSIITAALSAAFRSSKGAAMSQYAEHDACLAFEVWDDRNADAYSVGDRIIVDTDKTANPGDVVLAVTPAGPTFGRLFVSVTSGADTIYNIKHDNPAFGMTTIASRDYIVGVCIEHTRRLAR